MLFGHRSNPTVVLLLSQRFRSGEFVFMQDIAPCSAHRAKTTQDDLWNVVPDISAEKASGSTTASDILKTKTKTRMTDFSFTENKTNTENISKTKTI